jgi:diacylglycerol kinase family enzyme
MAASDKIEGASEKAKKAAAEEKERLEKAGHEAKAFTAKENEKVKEEFEKIGHHGSRGKANPSDA